MASNEPAIPLILVNNNHASTESNPPTEPRPLASAPVTNANLEAEARTWWATLPTIGRFFNTALTLFVALATLVLAFVLFKPQALSTKLAVWTSQKDYLEYCQNHVQQTGGKSYQDCQEALRRVLPPPPASRLFRRFNVALNRGLALNRGIVLQLGSKPIRSRLDPQSTYSASNSSVDITRPGLDRSGVGIRPLLAAELIFSLLIFFVTWQFVLKACRTSWQRTRMNTLVGVGLKTKVEKNVQLISGPYEAWVPDFVARSFSSSIRKIRITQETSLQWRPSTAEINDTQPESTLRRRNKKSYVSTPYVKGVPIEIPDDGDVNVSCDESDSELWIPIDRPQNTRFNDRHFEKFVPAMAALIGTYASLLEVASKQNFTFYIDQVNSHSCETPAGGSEHFITAPAYTLPLSDHSRDVRAKLAVSPLVMAIRRNIMDHSDVVYVSPQLRSSWQLTLNKSDNFNANELTSSIVTRDYAGSSSFKSFVTKKMVPQMPTSSLISPFSSIAFAVHEDQNLVSIFVDTDDEHKHAWTILTRELNAIFVKGQEETLRLFKYPKGELGGTKDAVPLNVWIYHEAGETANDPRLHHKKSKLSNEIDDKFGPKSSGTRPSPAEIRKAKVEVYGELIQPMSRPTSNETDFALPPPALSFNADTGSIPEPDGIQASPSQAKQEANRPRAPLIVNRPSYEAEWALPAIDGGVLKLRRKKQLQRYALAHGMTLAEVTSEQFEDEEEPIPSFPTEDATDHIAEDERDSDRQVEQWRDGLRFGFGTYQDYMASARDVAGLARAKSSSPRHRVRKLIPGGELVQWYGRDESEPYGSGRRNAFSAPSVPYPSR